MELEKRMYLLDDYEIAHLRNIVEQGINAGCRDCIAIMPSLSAAFAQPVQPSALERLEEWVDAAGDGNERMYKIEAGRNWAGVLLYHNGAELLGCGEPTIDAAILAVLDAAEGE